MDYDTIMQELESLSNPDDVQGMAQYGIVTQKTFAVRIPELRRIAKEAGKDHELALKLWESGYRETRILACMIENPEHITSKQMDSWAMEFDCWEVCDQCCMKLFHLTPFAYEKIYQWSSREEEFVKRAAFTLIAVLAVHDKEAADEKFTRFFPLIIRESTDNRKYVKKAVNWALRQIGKRNITLNNESIKVAEKIHQIDSKSAKWIAADALKELKSEKIQRRFHENIQRRLG